MASGPASPRSLRETTTSSPRNASAPLRSSTPSSFATVAAGRAANSSRAYAFHCCPEPIHQRSWSARPSGNSVNVLSLTQPWMPKGALMRPITTRSDSPGGDASALLLGGGRFFAGDFELRTLDQLLDGIRRLRARANPVGDTV